MTDKHYLLLDLLLFGHQNGKTSKQLSAQTGIDPRKVREMLSEAVEQGYAIGSHPDDGYFMIGSEDDAKKALQHLKPRATAIFRRLRALERTVQEKFGDQIRLEEVQL